LAVRPAQDLVGACQRNLDPVEGGDVLRLEDVHQLLLHLRAFLQFQFGPPSPFDKLRVKAVSRCPLILSLSKDEGRSVRYVVVGPFTSSTLSDSERISLTSTLNDSGMPASNVSSPRT